MLYELCNSAFVVKLVRALCLFALIAYGDANAFVEKSFFPKTLGEFVKAELCRIKNLRVRLEGNLRAALTSLARLFQLHDGDATLVLLLVGLAIAPDFQTERFRQEVDARDAYAVQTSRNLICVCVELAARVKLGHHDFSGAAFLLLMIINGDTAPVINDCDRIVQMDCDFNRVAVSCQSLVNGIVNDFVNEMMQAQIAGRANVHGGAIAHCVTAF